MEFFDNMGVWAKGLPRHVAKPRGGTIIKGPWLDTNKGDSANPDRKARFVGKDDSVCVDPTLYAATFKLLLAHDSGRRGKGMHIMLSEDKRTTSYFNAEAKRELYVELPPEDTGYREGNV